MANDTGQLFYGCLGNRCPWHLGAIDFDCSPNNHACTHVLAYLNLL